MSARTVTVLSRTTDTEHISKPDTSTNTPNRNSFSATQFFVSSQNSIPVIYSDSLLQVLFMKSPYQMAVTVLRWGACLKTVVLLYE
jgi:hypothetical protein